MQNDKIKVQIGLGKGKAQHDKRQSIKDPKSLPAWLIRTAHREAVRMAKRTNKGMRIAESFERDKM